MFNGEFESLQAIHGTNTVKVPKPIKVRLVFVFYVKLMKSLHLPESLHLPDYLHLPESMHLPESLHLPEYLHLPESLHLPLRIILYYYYNIILKH